MGFLQNLINNATNSVSEGIKKRVEDGTFNKMATDFGNDVKGLGAGMVSIVDMAEKAFGNLKAKVAKSKAEREQERAERRAAQEERDRKAEQLRAERLAAMEQKRDSECQPVSSAEDEDGEPYEIPIPVPDDFMERLARDFDIQEEGDLESLCLVRLTAQTALFFANVDGDYTEREHEAIERFKEMTCDYLDGMGENAMDACEFVFDGIDRPCTINDIIAMTHRFTDSMDEKNRETILGCIDQIAAEVVEADTRDDMLTEDYYDQWRSEFGL